VRSCFATTTFSGKRLRDDDVSSGPVPKKRVIIEYYDSEDSDDELDD
jgi:hypothetical protein